MTWLTFLDIVALKMPCCSPTLLHIADSRQHTRKSLCLKSSPVTIQMKAINTKFLECGAVYYVVQDASNF